MIKVIIQTGIFLFKIRLDGIWKLLVSNLKNQLNKCSRIFIYLTISILNDSSNLNKISINTCNLPKNFKSLQVVFLSINDLFFF